MSTHGKGGGVDNVVFLSVIKGGAVATAEASVPMQADASVMTELFMLVGRMEERPDLALAWLAEGRRLEAGGARRAIS